MLFSRFERFVFFIIFIILILDLLLIYLKDIRVDWVGYGLIIAFSIAILALGLFYRACRREERIAETLVLAACFIFFTIVGSVLNYMFLPIHFPRIDEHLALVDDLFGYRWPDFVQSITQWPYFSYLLKLIYSSTLVQFAFIILLLGFTANSRKLSQFVLTGIIGALISIFIWVFFPTFGPSAIWSIEDEVLKRADLIVGPAYGGELIKLSLEGVDYLSPANLLGLIGFPSYHTIMAAMSVVFTWQFYWIRMPMLCLNALMIPALLAHGGHHLCDFLGGLIVFTLAYLAAEKLIRAIGNIPDRGELAVNNKF